MCVVYRCRGGFLGGESGVRECGGGSGGDHLLYSIFTTKERIKMYKETPLSVPKTQNSHPLASST